jgi:hypothetical protein
MNMNDISKRIPTLLAAVQAAAPDGLLDSELAVKVGIADRDALRSILAVMAADGQVAAVDLAETDPPPSFDAGWVDGEAPLIIRLAPTDAPTLASYVTDAILAAGMDGLEEDVLHDILIEDIATEVPCDLSEHMPEDYLQPTLDALIADGVIRSVGCNHYAFTAKKWALLIDETTRRVSEENPKVVVATLTFLRLTALERLLAGRRRRWVPSLPRSRIGFYQRSLRRGQTGWIEKHSWTRR